MRIIQRYATFLTFLGLTTFLIEFYGNFSHVNEISIFYHNYVNSQLFSVNMIIRALFFKVIFLSY